jgi:hypothetical protein
MAFRDSARNKRRKYHCTARTNNMTVYISMSGTIQADRVLIADCILYRYVAVLYSCILNRCRWKTLTRVSTRHRLRTMNGVPWPTNEYRNYIFKWYTLYNTYYCRCRDPKTCAFYFSIFFFVRLRRDDCSEAAAFVAIVII